MAEIPNPYLEPFEPTPIGVEAEKLATYALLLTGLKVTVEERAAVARVMGALLRNFPWIMEIEGVKDI